MSSSPPSEATHPPLDDSTHAASSDPVAPAPVTDIDVYADRQDDGDGELREAPATPAATLHSSAEKGKQRAVEAVEEQQPRPPPSTEATTSPTLDDNVTADETTPLAAETATPTPTAPSDRHSTSDGTDEAWQLRKIRWPPLAQNGEQQREVTIIMQNRNGPCSLLALCNILLVRGWLTLRGPPECTHVSFATLSSLLADHLLASSTDSGRDSTSALTVIPRTRTGLDLNPCFASPEAFTPGTTSGGGELALFELCNVKLVHGWVADAQDGETWDAVVGKAGDYDKAMEVIIAGEEAGHGLVLASGPEESVNPDDLTPERSRQVQDALLIQRFLRDTSTQLSYSGLFQLSTSTLPPNSLSALLRNSHLSVIYRRPDHSTSIPTREAPALLPPRPDDIDPSYSHEVALEVHAAVEAIDAAERCASTPQLYTLVTDSAFVNERGIVWESLEDVEGALSEFYDSNLKKTKLKNGDWVRERNTTNGQDLKSQTGQENQPTLNNNLDNVDHDLALAQQLQAEEYAEAERAEKLDRERRLQAKPTDPQPRRKSREEQVPPPAPPTSHQGPTSSLSSKVGRKIPKLHLSPGAKHAQSAEERKKCIIM